LVGGGRAHPAGLLHNCEIGICGVYCCECCMALIRGVRLPVLGCTGGDTVYEEFGPFDIGPGLGD
jgi:hypothetical protein